MKDNSLYMSSYFITFIIVGSLFLWNLFVGVIFFNYHLAEKREKNKILTEDQVRWLDIQKLLANADPDFASFKVPDGRFRKLVFYFSKSNKFETFILFCIILNILSMSLSYDGSSADYDKVTLNII